MHQPDLIGGIRLDLEKTFGAMSECVAIVDPCRRILFVNRAMENLFGYSGEELIGATSEQIYASPQDYAAAGEIHASAAQNKDGQKYAVRFKHKNGSVFTCEVMSTPLFNETGDHSGFLFIGRDISDRIALEEKAEESAATLQDAMESISEGFALYDADDQLVICNENYKKIYPDSAKAMMPGESFKNILKFGLLNGQYDTGSQSMDQWLDARLERHQNADGSIVEQKLGDGRWLRISERRTPSNGIAGIRTDITELKNTQEQLRTAYADITILTDSLSCSIAEVDPNGTCVFINEYGAQWFSSAPSELVGKNIRNILSQDLRIQTQKKFAQALAGERGKHEVNGLYPDGIRRDAMVEYIPKTNESGGTIGLIIFSTDITEKKKVETTLSELYSATSTRELCSDEKIQQILRIGCEHFDLPFGIISQIAEDKYAINWAECPNDEIQRGAVFQLGDTYCSHTLAADKPVAIAYTAKSSLAQHPCYKTFALEAYIGAPLLVDGERYGTINFSSQSKHVRRFSKTDREIIRQFADWVGNEIARQQDHKALMDAKIRLERIASIDDLTGILNRRSFMERANTEVARYRRTGKVFSAVLLDIDNFKSINDTYGHGLGDRVLKRFCDTLTSALRAIDVFGRIGGEEFCILLDSADSDSALMVCERLRKKISQNCRLPEMSEDVTCSLGIAPITRDDIEFSTVLNRADIALYQAKEDGRDLCRLYRPEPQIAAASISE
ncbi:sensor domain-containing diguanylate cyclase [Roseibium algae]|uniref:Diguanylate cyclase n=1 Tax=Roseibium algae TaxID=3123038 RepID=A0ABU8TG84_9HYPH